MDEPSNVKVKDHLSTLRSSQSVQWSTNGPFIWPTSDLRIINQQGDKIAIDICHGTAEFLGMTRDELSRRIVEALNKP